MRYFFLTFLAIYISFVLVGCAGLYKKLSKDKSKDEHLALIDKKIQDIEHVLSNLDTSTQNLGRRVDELSQKTTNIDTNYSKLSGAIDGLNSKVETKDRSLENVCTEAQRHIDDLWKKLNRIEEIVKIKTDLQNQIIVLLSQRSQITDYKIDQRSETMSEKAKELVERERESVKEETSEKKPEGEVRGETPVSDREKEELQASLDKALALYREGNYKAAVSKWEEVLIRDPENLEAKFNIEIAKEKIKSLTEK